MVKNAKLLFGISVLLITAVSLVTYFLVTAPSDVPQIVSKVDSNNNTYYVQYLSRDSIKESIKNSLLGSMDSEGYFKAVQYCNATECNVYDYGDEFESIKIINSIYMNFYYYQESGNSKFLKNIDVLFEDLLSLYDSDPELISRFTLSPLLEVILDHDSIDSMMKDKLLSMIQNTLISDGFIHLPLTSVKSVGDIYFYDESAELESIIFGMPPDYDIVLWLNDQYTRLAKAFLYYYKITNNDFYLDEAKFLISYSNHLDTHMPDNIRLGDDVINMYKCQNIENQILLSDVTGDTRYLEYPKEFLSKLESENIFSLKNNDLYGDRFNFFDSKPLNIPQIYNSLPYIYSCMVSANYLGMDSLESDMILYYLNTHYDFPFTFGFSNNEQIFSTFLTTEVNETNNDFFLNLEMSRLIDDMAYEKYELFYLNDSGEFIVSGVNNG